ncbi:MAG TPA: methionine biosynthesis protein MetW [Candidatus Bathyarchaeia archaeon]|jgi:methionine biosynthesis protein MetW
MKPQSTKIEQQIISGWIEQGASVLDLGCGDGELLALLIKEKQVRAQGIEINEQAIHRCVALGLSVFQEDIDTGLSEYSDKSFDFVILNQTFQQVKKPDFVLKEALRVGKKIIVGFPNFLYISARLQMFIGGKVPVTPALPYEWYDTPNLHFLSIADFVEYCRKKAIQIENSAFIGKNRRVRFFPNLLAGIGLFLLKK